MPDRDRDVVYGLLHDDVFGPADGRPVHQGTPVWVVLSCWRAVEAPGGGYQQSSLPPREMEHELAAVFSASTGDYVMAYEGAVPTASDQRE